MKMPAGIGFRKPRLIQERGFLLVLVCQHTPRPIMACATFMKPAMFAPFM